MNFCDPQFSSAENLAFRRGHEVTFVNRSEAEKKSGGTPIHALLIREIASFNAKLLIIL